MPAITSAHYYTQLLSDWHLFIGLFLLFLILYSRGRCCSAAICAQQNASGCLWLSFLFSCSPFSCFFLPFPFPAAIPLPPSSVHARQAEGKPLQEGSFLPTGAASGLSGGRASEAVVLALILMPGLVLFLILLRLFRLYAVPADALVIPAELHEIVTLLRAARVEVSAGTRAVRIVETVLRIAG